MNEIDFINIIQQRENQKTKFKYKKCDNDKRNKKR